MLKINQVSVEYNNGGNRVAALSGITVEIVKGKTYAIIGPSGCGKTSLLYLLAGLIKPTAGEILVDERVLPDLRQQTALILQEYGLLPWKTVWDNIALGLALRGISKEEQRRVLEPIIRELNLTECLKRYPAQLSGGQKQRVAFARALALSPELLLMDEPLSALDALSRENLQEMILKLWQHHHITFLLVTHSIEEAVYLGQEVIILSPRPGQIIKVVPNPEMGSPNYRHNPLFHRKCSEIRSILEEGAGAENHDW